MQNSTEQLIANLKALADPIRLRLLALCVRGEATVSELTEVMGQSQPRISQHLKQLCGAGLLERFRDGHFVYYRAMILLPSGMRRADSCTPSKNACAWESRAMLYFSKVISMGGW